MYVDLAIPAGLMSKYLPLRFVRQTKISAEAARRLYKTEYRGKDRRRNCTKVADVSRFRRVHLPRQ